MSKYIIEYTDIIHVEADTEMEAEWWFEENYPDVPYRVIMTYGPN
jgi:hypothetical protein